ncbi:uncharacterized protein [Coffea arabica]|uniref:Uncharacterized protein isoform X2 n=1 Tax=Coffea arabica TaxID=13443 RepID=A0ABM4UY69_COFAR
MTPKGIIAGENEKCRGTDIEKKIEFLESLTGKVSNRRSRRWLNDRLLMELVPRLNAEEIRGLFAPPPWGDDVPLSPFSMTNIGEWDKFRTVDMDKERRAGAHHVSDGRIDALSRNTGSLSSNSCSCGLPNRFHPPKYQQALL